MWVVNRVRGLSRHDELQHEGEGGEVTRCGEVVMTVLCRYLLLLCAPDCCASLHSPGGGAREVVGATRITCWPVRHAGRPARLSPMHNHIKQKMGSCAQPRASISPSAFLRFSRPWMISIRFGDACLFPRFWGGQTSSSRFFLFVSVVRLLCSTGFK